MPASNYDSWKSTDPMWESKADRARCAHLIVWGQTCDVPYEEHNDEIMGHEFEMPEPEGRDY